MEMKKEIEIEIEIEKEKMDCLRNRAKTCCFF